MQGRLNERRHVRSYVLRQGRITPAQQRACDELYPRYGIPYSAAPVDAQALFGRSAPLVLEIGSGMGETTAAIARAHPGTDYLAVEVHGPGIGSLLRRIEAERLPNLRVVRHDALDVLEHMIADGALAGIYLFFPDPWPKKRHHKRRIVQPAFAALAARKLAPGGILHAATDWQDYAEQMLAVLGAEPLLENTAAGFAPRPEHRPLTKFERRGLGLGHAVWDLVFRRR
ncbi:MAG: tRNA (guanosine(46)-N7)-methyltransferase TrmB [Betaproteobacteria bacterium]|nr:tRNA (guanosine(46)-N7)-methyltransferase TrmB [Betaproteobacteria bacterium]